MLGYSALSQSRHKRVLLREAARRAKRKKAKKICFDFSKNKKDPHRHKTGIHRLR